VSLCIDARYILCDNQRLQKRSLREEVISVADHRYNYPTVIAGLIGLWLNRVKRQLQAQGKDYAEEFHRQSTLTKESIQEAIERRAELDVEVAGLGLRFQRARQGYVLELCFRDELTARGFYNLLSVFKAYLPEEIPAEFADNLNLLIAILLNEAPLRLEGTRIVIDLPRERKFFAVARPRLHEVAAHPHAPA
jgi:hypothetical protein